MGLKSDGTIVVWGDNGSRQYNVPSPNTGFGAIAGGWDYCLAIRSPIWASAIDDPVVHAASVPGRLRVLSVAPNPIATSAEILFETRESGPVSMTVHDVGGRQVTTVDLGSLGPGQHRTSWAACGAVGLRMPAGVYFLRLRDVSGGSPAMRVVLTRGMLK